MQAQPHMLVWIDCEMTGLNPCVDSILEIAMIITDYQLNEHATIGPLIINHSTEQLQKMHSEVRQMHTKNGLINKVIESTTSLSDAQKQVTATIRSHCILGTALLAGNSVWQDGNFLREYMPDVMNLLYYRIIDVTTIKELVFQWYPDDQNIFFKKNETHRALDDIRESIAELAYYRKTFFK